MLIISHRFIILAVSSEIIYHSILRTYTGVSEKTERDSKMSNRGF